MLAPVIDWNSCRGCIDCHARSVCNTRAIVKIDEDEPPYIAIERCSRCAECVLACSFDAITMKNIEALTT